MPKFGPPYFSFIPNELRLSGNESMSGREGDLSRKKGKSLVPQEFILFGKTLKVGNLFNYFT
jgi:hypothetical protein